MAASAGFTLLEILVTITIITIVTSAATFAFPVIREQEALVHARQLVTSALGAAQTQALNEQRDPDCIAQVGNNPLAAKKCSDVGIFLQGEKIITFADIDDNNQYDNQDFRQSESSLPRPVTALTPASIVIEATPPNLTVWHNGVVVPAGSKSTISLRTARRTVTFSISSYGILENNQ